MKSILFFFVALSFCCTSCKTQKAKSEKVVKKTEETAKAPTEKIIGEGVQYQKESTNKVEDSLLARIQRTPCFGRCPIYILSFYKGGAVIYKGEKWVEMEGVFISKVSAAVLQSILDKAKEVGFWKMENVYDNEHVTDLPSTIVTIQKGDKLKVVANRYNGPEEEANFEQYLDNLVTNLNWEKVK